MNIHYVNNFKNFFENGKLKDAYSLNKNAAARSYTFAASEAFEKVPKAK